MMSSTGTPNTDVNVDQNFNMHLGQRYQLILAKMNNYKTTKTYSLSTANNQQIYPMPPGLVTIEGGYITVGSVNFPLTPINSRYNWEQLNAIQIQASALPQFYFVEQDTFQIWPKPQDVYTGKIYYHFRDRNLGVSDFTSGTVTCTSGSATISITGGSFTPAMVGRWFTVTDQTVQGQGYWFRVTGYTNASQVTLGGLDATPITWPYATATTSSFIIGETPELPEEMHVLLAWGTAADYYGSMRKDKDAMTYYNNMFYTGDPDNPTRDFEDRRVMGGLIGGINSYRDRDSRTLIRRKPKLNPLQYKVFATTLS
jgi:hypothetical protein